MIGSVPGTTWKADDGLHVDTRGLGPPDPMVAILWHVENLPPGSPIIAHLDRYPVHLFPELAARGCHYEVLETRPGDVRILLRPAP